MCVYVYVHINIYTHMEREREITCVCIYIYIYICTHVDTYMHVYARSLLHMRLRRVRDARVLREGDVVVVHVTLSSICCVCCCVV